MPEAVLGEGGGKSHWVLIAVAVVVVLYLVSKSGGAQGNVNASANADAAAVEQARLTAAGSAYAAYLESETANLQSNNAVRINQQNVSAAESIAATEAAAANHSASVAGRTSTNNSLIGTIGGIIAGVLGGLI